MCIYGDDLGGREGVGAGRLSVKVLSGGLIFVIEADEDSVSVSTDKKKKKKAGREKEQLNYGAGRKT